MNSSTPFAILQIRTGSTRLPGKMLMPFFEGRNIPELIISKVKSVLPASNIIIATTTSPKDDAIEAIAVNQGVKCFRGDENDVLRRFLDAIDLFGAENVIRICADNPFLRAEYLAQLIQTFEKTDFDYISFEFPDGTPIMRSHIGLFAEIMKADFLRKIAQKTTEPLYREHVTNYVYEHRNEFKTLFLPVPAPFTTRKDIRLTIDTAGDFESIQQLYAELHHQDGNFSSIELLDAIDRNPQLLSSMKEQIELNSK